jgi:hypothetical protein
MVEPLARALATNPVSGGDTQVFGPVAEDLSPVL